jgi:hypothetical protein
MWEKVTHRLLFLEGAFQLIKRVRVGQDVALTKYVLYFTATRYVMLQYDAMMSFSILLCYSFF